ncbi:MAG: MBOAT family protein [Oscillospiraceae bacterium]|nr:MBOAT family protein [Oscillospiraceae bacterium]
MVFNSFGFLIFYPIVLLLYFILPKRLSWIMLLLASYYFYISWNVELIYLIVFTTLISWVSAMLIEHTRKQGVRKLFLVLTLVTCLGVLFFYKYFNFLSDSVVETLKVFGIGANPFNLDLILPVGISFYTFQTLSYVIDVYRGDVKTERNFFFYALYVSFFPQLVAGPIERPNNLIPQLHARHRPTWENTRNGLRKMLIGFFKKVVVADLLATYVNAVYNDVANATGLGVLIATVLFAIQIYCDFAGYTDIAIGCAEIMGIKLMQNFNRPYIAQSIQEFWRRWHISLSTWFKDYIYVPLGGSRCAKWKNMRNILIVFSVSGLWHGAAWTFVIWGTLHGLYQVIGKLLKPLRSKMLERMHLAEDAKGVQYLRQAVTFALVCFAWIFFRANSTADAMLLVKKLFTDWSLSGAYFRTTIDHMGLTMITALISALSIYIMNRMDINQLRLAHDGDGAVPVFRYAYVVWVIAIAWLLLLAGDGASSFIYFQF